MINRLFYFLSVCSLIVACDSAGPSPSELVPVAVDDRIKAQGVGPPGVLANDVDPDNPADPDSLDAEYEDSSNVELKASKVSGLEDGSVEVKENGEVQINNVYEDSTFTYKAKDTNNGESDTAKVTIVE